MKRWEDNPFTHKAKWEDNLSKTTLITIFYYFVDHIPCRRDQNQHFNKILFQCLKSSLTGIKPIRLVFS